MQDECFSNFLNIPQDIVCWPSLIFFKLKTRRNFPLIVYKGRSKVPTLLAAASRLVLQMESHWERAEVIMTVFCALWIACAVSRGPVCSWRNKSSYLNYSLDPSCCHVPKKKKSVSCGGLWPTSALPELKAVEQLLPSEIVLFFSVTTERKPRGCRDSCRECKCARCAVKDWEFFPSFWNLE